MNAQFYQSASYVPDGGTKSEKTRRQEQWNEYQRQQRASMSNIPEDPNHQSSLSRKRADSHQLVSTTHRSRRSVDASHMERIHPVSNDAHPARLSGNFNAPTHVELERDREHRKSLRGVEKLRSRVRGWVRA
ncbi:hypothetical protein CC86DRAFT_288438 [Ophiobolus disseminans]|uniref:Uncharacterized protein n=1 Tax=Ophiobolus disseminans TaxID=1469910 RepID=A0A6A7A5K6_9PLEO|nr:hypothetical protein CC86DRAFT_288438 [Ophiobolus disseminans]